MSEAGSNLENEVEEMFRKGQKIPDETMDRWEAEASSIGVLAWTWLQIMMVNIMYCGGASSRWLTDTMMHGEEPTPLQKEVIARKRQLCERWCRDKEEKVIMTEWDKAAEGLTGIYTGQSISKSYPLTLEAILPTTPGRGEAARVDLREVVSEDLVKFVDEPDLVRIPDDELVNPRTTAKVQVESQEEWDKVVSHLVSSGMLEREVESETLTYGKSNTRIRNGAFGVHKAWIQKSDGSWLRSLRLIINLIPSNGFQRTGFQKYGLWPIVWGSWRFMMAR